MTQKTFLAILATLGFLAADTAFADNLTIANPSFESPLQNVAPYYSFGAAGSTAVDSWTIGGDGRAGVQNASQFVGTIGPAPDGQQFGYINNSTGGNTTTLSQVLTANLQASTQYTLAIDVGGRTDGNNPGTGYSIQLFAGGNLLGGITPVTPPTGTWTAIDMTYTSPGLVSADPLEIMLSMPSSLTFAQLDFDNVSLSTVSIVPEPSTLSLAGLMLIVPVALRILRKTRTA